MTDSKERLTQEGFTEPEVDAILQRAAELQSRSEQTKERLSPEALKAGAGAVGISEEFVEQAIRELKAEREQQALRRAARRRTLILTGLILGAFLLLSALYSYGTLSSRLADIEQRRAQLENVLQSRQDKLRSLIPLAKESASSERQLFASIEGLIEQLQQAKTLEERQALEEKLSEAARRLGTVLAGFRDEIAGAENRITVERQRYNEAVAAYNRTARSFPILLIRPFLGFPAKLPFFQQQDESY